MQRLSLPSLIVVLLIGVSACSDSSSHVLSDEDLATVSDTLLALDTEFHQHFDNIDCTSALSSVGDKEPIVVGGGTVVRTLSEFQSLCEAIVSNRSKAVLDVTNLVAHALSPNAGYVVREGDYTVYDKVGSVSEEYFIIFTTIWHKEDGSWTMAHLHESWRAPDPATP